MCPKHGVSAEPAPLCSDTIGLTHALMSGSDAAAAVKSAHVRSRDFGRRAVDGYSGFEPITFVLGQILEASVLGSVLGKHWLPAGIQSPRMYRHNWDRLK